MGDYSDLHDQEYSKCLSTGLYSEQDCSSYADCVYQNVVGVPYGVPVLMCRQLDSGESSCIWGQPSWTVPFTEANCYSSLTSNSPITYPGIPVDTGDDNPPPTDTPPVQTPPCDPYFDCKNNSKSYCLVM